MAVAPAAQAYDTATMKASCSAVKFPKSPSKTTVVVGTGYKGDKVRVDRFACKAKEKTWYSRGTVTRRSDGKRVRLRHLLLRHSLRGLAVTAYPKRP
ncbi:hypothetical protein [Streptomyces viridochromogenes]|uniref:hypothetical protein n=1 Tax=Streptomyces viridochromogenes TaxID=1938 RepID=UPI0031DB1382